MSLKILGGLANGRSLFVPKGDTIRPTSIRLKRRLFDSRQNWEGKIFVDLCAGSGAIGLEVWSRGAEQLVLVEPGKKVVPILKKNIELIKREFADEARERSLSISVNKAQDWLKFSLESYLSEDVVLFLDPPYHLEEVYQKCIKQIVASGFKGELLIESDRQKGPKQDELEQLVGSESIKTYEQGTSFIQVFHFD